ncbi:ABC transporter permease [Ningiella sp. W23]|uniref:ABC transporter permease n=1 Tax=Ningiella sp. W23 TaxID=3023715 RepID=UPI003756A8E3
MFKNYLVTAWRNILKNGMFSAINILGLALGLMSCILISLFVREQVGYDKWLTDSDRVVRMHTAYYRAGTPPFLTVRSAGNFMEAVRDYATAEVEEGTRLISFGASVIKDQNATAERVNLVDPSFFDVFDLPFVYGAKENAFKKPFDLILTEETAIKYFGKTDVVGETLTLCCAGPEPSELTVTGVVKDLPKATHLSLDLIVLVPPALIENNPGLNTWTSVNVYTYFKMRDGVSIEDFQERLTYWVDNESPLSKDIEPETKVSDGMKHKLMALEDIHLHAKKDAGTMGDLSPLGDATMITAFSIIAGLILVIACINFMNLATARASQRAREVAMRKVLGASRKQVTIQFLGEAVALVFISLLVALVLVELVLPIYNQVLGSKLELSLFTDVSLLGAILAVGLFVGIGAGIYPALYLSRFLPGHILKSNKSSESGKTANFRTLLVVFQFSASIALVICTAVIFTQTRFAQSVDVGYVSDNKLILQINGMGDARESLRQELLNLPEITSVVFSSEAPSQDNENNAYFSLLDGDELASQEQIVNYHNMGYGFFEAYEVAPIAGRLFNQDYGSDEISDNENGDLPANASAVINESALAKFGFANAQAAIGQTLEANIRGQQHLTIVGVIPDIYFRSIKFGVRASIYTLNPQRFSVASLSFNTNNPAALRNRIEQIWRELMPTQPISLRFLDGMMEAQYNDERIQSSLFSAFSILVIVIACLGLYGLAAFTTERRTKEIGIRKVMGASVKDIVSLLVWQFSKPVLIANIVAWPLASFAMITWLENFSYRISALYLIPICIGVGFILLMIAWATVGANASAVARANPINALRQD